MRKVVFLLAIVAVAVSPSLASAKAKAKAKPHAAKVAKVEKPAAGPNDNTFRLFDNMFK